LILYNFLHKID